MLHLPAITALAGFLLLAQSEPEKALRRAVQLQQDGDLKGAIEQYQALLAQNPDLAEARVKLGDAYASSGRYQDAVAQYEQALESGGLENPAGARYALGLAHFRMADFERAKQVLVQVVAAGSKGRESLQLLASCHFNLGEWQKVIDLLSPLEMELS
ncbi:MAG: tetratricopeptide repeat protein, partial [Candidatus Aminicenantes bacterium]|nr:tetratricopeptide repeat protein [Candidatus Aminicenantes bacterium]